MKTENIEFKNEIKLLQQLDSFIDDISALHTSLPLSRTSLQALGKSNNVRLDRLIADSKGEVKRYQQDGVDTLRVPSKYIHRFNNIEKMSRHISRSLHLTPRSYFVTMVSQYDALVGQIIRYIFKTIPSSIDSTERTVKLSDLVDLKSPGDIKQFYIDETVSEILRSSHYDHLSWMNKKLKSQLDKNNANPLRIFEPDLLDRFLEITQRRHLFVHTDGIVSSQYLKECKNNQYLDKNLKRGDTVNVDNDYFKQSYHCLVEFTTILCHIIIRSANPNAAKICDSHLVDISFSSISHKEYKTATNILRFFLNSKFKISSEYYRLSLTLNLAQCFKWTDQLEQCNHVLDKEEWETKGAIFLLAYYSLIGDYHNASQTMESIKDTKDFSETCYNEWPIFKDLIKSTVFLETFKRLYNKEFIHRPEDTIVIDFKIQEEEISSH